MVRPQQRPLLSIMPSRSEKRRLSPSLHLPKVRAPGRRLTRGLITTALCLCLLFIVRQSGFTGSRYQFNYVPIPLDPRCTLPPPSSTSLDIVRRNSPKFNTNRFPRHEERGRSAKAGRLRYAMHFYTHGQGTSKKHGAKTNCDLLQADTRHRFVGGLLPWWTVSTHYGSWD